MVALGIRNNNPGNLEASSWTQGLPGYVGSDGRFAQFGSPDAGFNALQTLLTNKYNKGLTTPRQIIGSWAPASDGNNVDAYAKYVGSKAGVGPDDPLTKDNLPAAARAIAQYESPGSLSGAGGGNPMPDQGVLAQTAPTDATQGVLSDNGGWKGTGGLGNTLQQVGAWLQTPNNPSGGAALLQQAQAPLQREQQMRMQMTLAGKPQLVDAGADPISGRKRFVLFNPLSGKVSTPTLGGGDAGSGTGGGDNLSTTDFDRYSAVRDKFANGQASVEDMQKAAPAMLKSYADALVKGTAIPSNLGNRAGQLRPYAIELAHTMDKNFDENQIGARQQFTKDLADTNNPAKVGGAIASSAKVIGHASDLSDNLAKLQKLQYFSGAQGDINKLQQWMKARGTDDEFNTLMNQIGLDSDVVASEISKLANGGKPALAEQEHMRSMLDPSSRSTAAVQGGLRTVMGIMHGSVDPLVQNVNTAFGKAGTPEAKTVEDYWSDATKKQFNKVMSTRPQAYSEGATGAAPAAAPAVPGTPAAAPAAGAGDPLAAAKAAIAQGASRRAVIQRLQQNGIDPGGL